MTTKDWKKTLLAPEATIADAIKIIDESSLQIALVVDRDRRLLGTVTDGDIRRGILRHIPLEAPATEVMRKDPVSGKPEDAPQRLLEIMRGRDIRQLPVLDAHARVIGLVLRDDVLAPEPHDNWVVLMAGGLGNRLRPMTADTPKPMLKVGHKPLLQTILESFIEQNFRRFYVSINYLGDQVKRHLGDGSNWNVDIRYLEEEERLGTAGALGLIRDKPDAPLIVMNADVLTKINFNSLLDFHREQKASATMCVREYDFQVPFGVVETENHRIVSIEEKPVHVFFVNAGIYVLNPETLGVASGEAPLDMPEFFERVIAAGREAAVFPIREYWLDIGRIDDFERANGEFDTVFQR